MILALLAVLTLPPQGDYDHSLTTAAVCVSGSAGKRRAKGGEAYVPYSLKDKVYNAYGIPRHYRKGYVIDHFEPVELGGLGTEGNLWPQQRVVAHKKDLDEDELHREVCRGQITLEKARFLIIQWWGRQ